MGYRKLNMVVTREYNTSNILQMEQFHDEIVNKFDFADNKFILYLDDLHFDYGYDEKKCKIIFSNIEDIFSDISFTFMKIYKTKIKKGKKLYLDEFAKYTRKQDFSFEIHDIFLGYEKILIVGKIVNCKFKYGNFLCLSIDSACITYQFS